VTPDYSTWLTKQQAADAIGVSTKTIESFAKDAKIQQAAWRPSGRGPEKAVYNPDDVARIAQERRPGLPPFVLPASPAGPSNGNGHGGAIQTLHSVTPSGEDVLRLVFAAALRALASEPATSENSEKLFLDVEQAAAYLYWTPRDVRRAVRAGELDARNKEKRDWRTWRIRRKDLEQL